MTDMKSALAALKPREGSPKTIEDDRLERLQSLQSPLANMTPEARGALIKRAQWGVKYEATIVASYRDQFPRLVRDYESLPPDSQEARQIRELIEKFTHKDKDSRYCWLARAALALALIEYTLENRPEVGLKGVRTLLEGVSGQATTTRHLRLILGELLLIEDAKGSIRFFGKQYALPEHLVDSSLAKEAHTKLEALIERAAFNDREHDRYAVDEWTKRCTSTLEELIAGKPGRARGNLRTERPQGMAVRQGGVIFWDSTGKEIFISAAFRGVAGHVNQAGLVNTKVPLGALVAERLPEEYRAPVDRRRKFTAIRGLFARSRANTVAGRLPATVGDNKATA